MVFLISYIWSFPLENMTLSGIMCPELKLIIRGIWSIVFLLLGLLLLFFYAYKTYKKYTKDIENLTDEELKKFVNYFNESKK